MNGQRPLISVIITCYNYGRFLGQAIESALNQTYEQVEVIVVDDGSMDDSLKVAATYAHRIRILSQQNQGVCKARNNGFRESTGQFINFLDADDWLLPEKLDVQMEVFNADPGLDMVVTGRYDADEEGNIIGQTLIGGGEFSTDYLLNNRSFALHCVLVRRERLEQSGGFYEGEMGKSWTEDTDLWFRLFGMGARMRTVPTPLAVWRKHTTITSRSEDLLSSYSGVMRMVERLLSLELPYLNAGRLENYRRLVSVSFCARLYNKGFKSEAKALYQELWIHTGWWLTGIQANKELYMNVAALERRLDINQQISVIEQILAELSEGIPSEQQSQIEGAMYMVFADITYGAGNAQLARRYLIKALILNKKVLLRSSFYPTILRCLIGPGVGGKLGILIRNFKGI